jgi:hypothetical protein
VHVIALLEQAAPHFSTTQRHIGRRIDAGRSPTGIDQIHAVLYLGHIRLPRRDYLLDGLGQQIVIGVQKRNNLSLARRDPCVERRTLAAILLQYWDNTVSVAEDDLWGFVGRAIVYNYYLDARVGLAQSAVDSLSQEPSVVVAVYDDADQ